MRGRRGVTLAVAALLGGAVPFVAGACGDEERGGVEVEGARTGATDAAGGTDTAPGTAPTTTETAPPKNPGATTAEDSPPTQTAP